MSIVALKRKTAARYGPHSAAGGFSLNGSTRFKGPGEVSLAESVTRTPFRGTAPMGHGGGARCRVRGIKGRAAKCNSKGDYLVQVHNSGSGCTNDGSIKRSSVSTGGMLEKRDMCSRHGAYPCTWVKQQPLDTGDVALNNARKLFACAVPPAPPAPLCNYMGYTRDQNVHTLTYAQYNLKLRATQFCGKPVFPFAVRQECARNYLRVEDLP